MLISTRACRCKEKQSQNMKRHNLLHLSQSSTNPLINYNKYQCKHYQYTGFICYVHTSLKLSNSENIINTNKIKKHFNVVQHPENAATIDQTLKSKGIKYIFIYNPNM